MAQLNGLCGATGGGGGVGVWPPVVRAEEAGQKSDGSGNSTCGWARLLVLGSCARSLCS